MFERTKPGTLLKHQIPIQTSAWKTGKPGYVEMDLVSHSGLEILLDRLVAGSAADPKHLAALEQMRATLAPLALSQPLPATTFALAARGHPPPSQPQPRTGRRAQRANPGRAFPQLQQARRRDRNRPPTR